MPHASLDQSFDLKSYAIRNCVFLEQIFWSRVRYVMGSVLIGDIDARAPDVNELSHKG